jgi:hypothetical protein
VRNCVLLRLHFPDGYSTTAQVFSFHGLADGKDYHSGFSASGRLVAKQPAQPVAVDGAAGRELVSGSTGCRRLDGR